MGWYTRINREDKYSQLFKGFTMEGTNKDKCSWCKYNKYRCVSDDVVATCDFRTLPQKKEAVIERIKYEKKFLDEIKKKGKASSETDAKKAFDIISGINIMTEYLMKKQDMTKEEIMKECGFPEMSWSDKAKLVWKMKALEKSRGKKNG